MLVVNIVMGVCAAIMLVAMFTELFGVLFKSMKVEDQKVWEYDHVQLRGYAKRRRQLQLQLVIVGALMCLFLILGIRCWMALDELSISGYSPGGRDRFGEALFGGGALLLLALVCGFRVGILRAKFRAIRQLREF